MLLGDVLQEAFQRASATIFGDRVALYLVSLKDEAGFALALAVHEKVPGADPAILRERSQARGVREPMMVGSAPVETLARVAEGLGGGERAARRLLGWTVRELHRAGDRPVLVMTEGIEVVSTLAVLGAPGADAESAPPSWPAGAIFGEDGEAEIHGWTVPIGEA
jgi:hypothetical protein